MIKALSIAALLVLGATAAQASCYQDSDARCITLAGESETVMLVQTTTMPGAKVACPTVGGEIEFDKKGQNFFQNDEGTILRKSDKSISIQMDDSAPVILNEISCPQ